MKQIRLIRMTLNNFKGMSFILDPQGEDTDIFGRNATGKTTLADAFSWLLFDKDSLGRGDFEIKSLDATGEAEHGLEHSVEATLHVNGQTMTLKKIYHEIWSKKRGSAKAVFAGNTTDYYLNGVPVQKKDYVGTVAELAGDENIFRLLTTPTAFPSLHWQKQRALLLEVCGNVTDDEVVASNPDLAPLTELLIPYKSSKTPFDDLKKVIASRKSEINKELDRIPVRIDEQKRMMPDVSGLDQNTLIKEIHAIETGINDAKLRLQGVDNGGSIAELSKELQGLNYDISQLENKYYLEGMKHVVQVNARINELQSGRDAEIRKTNDLKAELSRDQARVASLEKDLQLLREKWVTIDAEAFTGSIDENCPACNQALPSDRVQEARDKALAQFNNGKAGRLLQVETRGKELRAQLDMFTQSIEDLHGRLIHSEGQATGDDQLATLTAERDTLKALAEDFSQIPGRAGMLEQKSQLETEIKNARGSLSVDRDAILREISELNAKLIDIKDNADKFRRRELGTARIENLKADEKHLTAEFEKLEGQLYLCEAFIKAKVSMLTERINGLFQLIRFKLFETQVNGGISECCEMTINGIPYNGGLNSGARLNGGLDACRTFSQHYGLLAPIFVDNAESVCELIDMGAQVIRLVVSERDAVLRVEAGKKRMAA